MFSRNVAVVSTLAIEAQSGGGSGEEEEGKSEWRGYMEKLT